MEEVKFARSIRTIVIIVGVFLALQIIVVPILMSKVQEGSWIDVIVIEIVPIILLAAMMFPFLNQRYIRFDSQGISYVRYFRRHFMSWGDITAVSNSSLNQFPILRLVAGSHTVNIMLSEFLDAEEVVKFIDQNLNAINHDRR